MGLPCRSLTQKCAALDLLLRKPPPTESPNDPLQYPQETTIEAACRIALQLDGNVLAIQGPPGTGKTYTGAQIVCALVRAGLNVGVTAVSHKVIVNLLKATSKQARKDGLHVSLVHRQQGQYDEEWGIQQAVYDYHNIRAGLGNGTFHVLGATAWCWAKPEFKQSVDVLIVDEAGQMSLANVLACAPAARSIVLLGDPQQLEQPLQSSHPEGSEVSALYHLLDGADTMPPNQGLFLDQTYRLHPDIARFTSEIYYEGRVKARSGLEHQTILPRETDESDLMGSGLRYVPVAHDGNQARSPEEIKCIRRLVSELLEHSSWQDQDGTVRPLTPNDILIVAPYNAQVSALVEALPRLVRSDWHRRSVPRPRGACGNLLNDVVESGGCSSGYGVPLQPIPVQCRDVSRSRAMHSGGKPCAVPPGVPYSAPNEDGQWLLQIQGTRAHAPIDPSSIILDLKPS